MANTPISGFSSGAPAQSGDEFVIARSGANYKLATSDIQGYLFSNQPTAVGYSIDGNGSVITTGVVGVGVTVPFNCTINSVTLLANATGSIVIDIWKDTYANFPPTVSDSICASAKPTISSGIKSEDTTLTGWTKTISAGDVLYFNVDSCVSITNCLLTLKVTRT